jgi:hypothetical protein
MFDRMDTTPRKTPLIELRLWRQFLAVAEELHFGRAAQRLNMTQPPLTQAIAQLEVLLGLRLFDRTKRSVQLTAAGAALVPEARDLLARAQALPAYARASADGEAGRSGWPLSRRWVLTCCRAGCGLFASNTPRCSLS